MSVLVLGAHGPAGLAPDTLRAVAAAQGWAQAVDLLLLGHGLDALRPQLEALAGVRRVLLADAAHLASPVSEDASAIVENLIGDYQALLAAHGSVARDVLPRVAARCGVGMSSDVLEILEPGRYVRPAYAGNLLLTVRSADALQVLSVRALRFHPLPGRGTPQIETLPVPAARGRIAVHPRTRPDTDRPPLSGARVVVSGGRALGSAQQYQNVLAPLALRLGAALGATRAAVDAGYAPNESQVGQTGTVVAPALYLAIGISGAAQHLAGMRDSQVIVAINNDPEAPIFQVADVGLVADLFDAVPALTQALQHTHLAC